MLRNMTMTIEETAAGPVALYSGGAGTRPLVLLHGNGHSIHEFDRIVPLLAGQYRLLGWDMPGHGASNAARFDLSIDERAVLLGDMLAGRAQEPAVLVGTSIGAFIAAALAVQRPDQVAALLLVEMQVRDRAWWDAAWPLVDRMFGVPRQDFDAVQARLCSPLDDALLGRWNADREQAGAESMIAAMEAIRDHDAAATLSALTVPTHFLFGEKGPAADCIEAARQCTPHAGCGVIPGAGHFVSIDQPESFAAAVAGMFRGREVC